MQAMYCEARTSTGLGCDSLGLVQCGKCTRRAVDQRFDLDLDAWSTRNEAYQRGLFGPRYPVPAIKVSCDIWPDRVIITQSRPCTNGYYSKVYRDRGNYVSDSMQFR